MALHVIHLQIAVAHSVNTYQDVQKATHSIMKHAIANLSRCALKISVGMAQHVILTITAAAHNVRLDLGASSTTGLTMIHAHANLSRCALKISAGMALHVIHLIIVLVLHVIMCKSA
jgi:hypothetical protein